MTNHISQEEPLKNRRGRLILLAAILVAGTLCAWWLAASADREMREDLIRQTRLVAGAVDPERIKTLTGTEADLTSPDYLRFKEQLAAMRTSNPKYRFINLMGRNADGKVFYFVDSEPAGSKDESPPGQVYEEAPEEYLRVIDTKIPLAVGPYIDRWGTWISALVPLTDPKTNKLIAMLGMDIDARDWKRDVTSRAALPVGLLLLLMIGLAAALTASGRAEASPKPVLRRLLPVLTILLILLFVLAGALLWQQHQERLNGRTALVATEVQEDLQELSKQQAWGLAAVAQTIAMDARARQGLRSGDRERLLADWKPLYETLHKQGVTQFIFFDAKRVCLLRVNKPELHGDRLDRVLILEAERTGKIASGIELGPMLGVLTVRAIMPVFDGPTLLGYLDLGKEISDVLRMIHADKPGVKLAVAIQKKLLKRDSWESGMRMLGREADWERLPHSVVIYASQGRLPDDFAAFADHDPAVGHDHDREIAIDSKVWRFMAMPLKDASGKEVGDLLVMNDITALKAAFNRDVTLGGMAGAILLLSLLAIVFVMLRRTDAGIRAQQKALREREERFRSLVEGSPNSITLFDKEGRYAVINHSGLEAMGWTEDDVLGRRFPDVWPEETRPVVEEALARALQGEQSSFEADCIRPDGASVAWWVVLNPIRNDDGSVAQLVGISTDVTDRKQAEEALRKSEATIKRKLKAILEPEGEIGTFKLSDIIDKEDLQMLMNDFFQFTGAGSAILDIQGNVLVACDWQDICTRFHRVHPITQQHCFESDTVLTSGTAPGEVKLYPCKNGLWDVVTPIHIDGNHIGNIFFGQFFFDDESPDSDRFRRQARQCGFDEEAYLAALDRVPRWSREKVDQIMAFYTRLAATISMQGYGNLRLARALTALRESEKMLSRAQEIAHTGSWRLDLPANRLTWSDEVYRIFGCEPKEFAATYEAFLDFVHPDDRAAVNEAFSLSVREGIGGYAIEHRIIRRNSGEVRYVHERCIHERDDAGAIIQSTGMVQDITERKKAESEREKLQAQLTQAQKMESVGRLAGGVAHDFNNMLSVILGHTEFAMEQVAPTEPLHANLEEIQKAAQRSADLTRQLLAFARKQTVAPRVLDLNSTIESMLKMLRRLIGEDIDLLWKPGHGLWPVRMDHAQLDQILVNLCVNARDAIASVGKVTIETDNASFDEDYCARHEGFVPGDYALLAVSDNGFGMDAETIFHLFEPFFTTKELGKGTGLGLATVYGAVKQNNGFVNVYSEPGQGATFKIYLPRHQAKAAETEESKPQAAERGSETILLVEDEPAILRMTTIMLERLGYSVLPAPTPGEAIRLAQEHTGHIDLVMTDVVMPEINGRDLAKNLLPIYPDIRLLFMSGYTANVIAHHGVLDEGVHFVQKPFSKKDLGTKIREALG